MLPSSTVENYLKAIYQGQSALSREERLVPMGHVASSLGVTPGTATTMVKALAESGLAEYEPYSGVRLSAAGEKLAGLVLRRHRLVAIPPHHLESLLTCPIGLPLRVTRIADQDPAFLRFIEKNDLKPGQAVEVERRDAAADSVLLRGTNRRSITIGARAASKLLVEVVGT